MTKRIDSYVLQIPERANLDVGKFSIFEIGIKKWFWTFLFQYPREQWNNVLMICFLGKYIKLWW